ncbi:UDP-N-acetylmuramate--L-alanine ligase [Leptolyngbya sp. FACHB-36]|uniref:UDP-N-acetylmuramate--L-alanine ligase n=1 Tax=Leptolyngbya sp. FACHB-36 TaxID=2692808 RepID=UPI0016805AA2|nr:UDP-N-acetylmuramate--L-alanine ligase [Leptolyngbya sp. FACHB-36]MBD2022107.1 UDP-N-acetylmuramate--L-alanine ligase [Leptolyngbya sp. FACHB-36]
MLNSMDFSGRPFHFIGIGGIGMSALAYVLAKRNLPVSGSDLRLSHITQRLQEQGAHIFWSQDASNLEFFRSPQLVRESRSAAVSLATLPDTEDSRRGSLLEARSFDLPQVICSTAIHLENAEYQAAIELGCPIFHRSDVLAALIQQYQGIAVAGTHGKTTTSSLIGYLLLQAGLDPTIVVGGEVNAWSGNAYVGNGPHLVAEADESDGSLVKLSAQIGIITNIELDHPDHYHTLDEVVDIFQTFAQHCQTLIGSIDCPTVRDRLKPTISYSLDKDSGADYAVDCVTYRADGTTARVWERGVILGRLDVKLLGQHNLSNALAAVAVGRLLKLDFATISKAIATFEGARRRFEHRGEYNGILFVDDYAHHPSEVQATLSAARLQTKGPRATARRRVVAIFQPHRYSRTQTFLSEFAASFGDADVVVVSDIYSAGEANLGTLTGEQVAAEISAHHPAVYYQPSLAAIGKLLTKLLLPGDIALFLGAGNLNQLIPEVMAHYECIEQGLSQDWCNQA